MNIKQEIYSVLEALSEPALLPAPWSALPAPPAYRRPLWDCRVAARLLREKFSDEQLILSGAFVRGQQSPNKGAAKRAKASPRLFFNPHLALGSWLLLRRAASEPPFDIVTKGGCISGVLPVLAALDDATTRDLLDVSGGTMFVTFKMDDAAVLHSLGFPAVPAAGLEKLKGSQLDRFCKVFDVRPLNGAAFDSDYDGDDDDKNREADEPDDAHPPDQAGELPTPPGVSQAPPESPQQSPPPLSLQEQPAAGTGSPGQDPPAADRQPSPKPSSPRHQATAPTDLSLCFVACHPAQLSLEIPEQLASIEAHLRELAGNLDLLFDKVYVWQPAPSLELKLSYALINGTLKHVMQMIIVSLESSMHTMLLPDRAPTCQPAKLRLPEVWEAMHHVGGDRLTDRAAQLQDYRRLIDQQVTGPLLEQAEAHTDPVLKAHSIGQALSLRQQLNILPEITMSKKTQRQASNGELRPEEVELFKAEQTCIRDILKSLDEARKKAPK